MRVSLTIATTTTILRTIITIIRRNLIIRIMKRMVTLLIFKNQRPIRRRRTKNVTRNMKNIHKEKTTHMKSTRHHKNKKKKNSKKKKNTELHHNNNDKKRIITIKRRIIKRILIIRTATQLYSTYRIILILELRTGIRSNIVFRQPIIKNTRVSEREFIMFAPLDFAVYGLASFDLHVSA